jgi:hypothetical protein
MTSKKDVFTEEAMAAELDAAIAADEPSTAAADEPDTETATDELCPATTADELSTATAADELPAQVPKALWQPAPQCPSVFPLSGVSTNYYSDNANCTHHHPCSEQQVPEAKPKQV